jgi:tellurite resistance protein
MSGDYEMDWIDRDVTIDAVGAAYILAAMRAVAAADGKYTATEAAIIGAFEKRVGQLPPGSKTTMSAGDMQDALMRAVILTALADGQMTDKERDIILKYAHKIRLTDADVAQRVITMKRYFLNTYMGKELFAEAVFQVGRGMGMSEEDLEKLAQGS